MHKVAFEQTQTFRNSQIKQYTSIVWGNMQKYVEKRKYFMCELQNDFLRVTITLDIGSHIWDVYDKLRKRHMANLIVVSERTMPGSARIPRQVELNAIICYIPFGALEWHDMHVPMGTDSFITHGLCLRMADLTGGVVLPPHHWSVSGVDDTEGKYLWEKAEGSLFTADADTWQAEIRAQVEAVFKKKWRIVVLFAGHVGQPERNIIEKVTREYCELGEGQVVAINPYAFVPGDHAGRHETNVILGIRPSVMRDAPSVGNPFCRESKDALCQEDRERMVNQIVTYAGRNVRDALARSGANAIDACPQIQETESEVNWTAAWIAPPGKKPENYYFLARKAFDVLEMPQKCVLRIAADSRYAAYINGRFVGNGPVRGTHRRYFFDSYDVSGCLRPGQNWIATEVYCPVRSTYTTASYAPGLVAEINGLVASDGSWEVQRDLSHLSESPIYTNQIGYSEWRDMRAESQGWQTGQDKESNWVAAKEIGTPESFGKRVTVARPIMPLTQDVLFPLRVVACGSVPDAGEAIDSPEYAALMSEELHKVCCETNFENTDFLTRSENITTINPFPENRGAYVILDFDREIFGQLVLDIEVPTGTVMDIGHDEALENNRLVVRRKNYRFADRFVLRQGKQTISQFLHNRGFRYIQIVFRNFQQPVRIHNVKVINRVYPKEPVAEFSCYDRFLSRLWQSCVNTLRLCSADTFMDCIWREQAFWTSDQCVTNLYYLALTGDADYTAHNLQMGADGALSNGLIPPVYPSARTTLFPSLPALWTFSLHDYYLYTGGDSVLQAMAPVMEKALCLYDDWRDEDGLIPDQPEMWNFIDWGYGQADVKLGGKTAALNMLVAAAYKRAGYLEHALGNMTRAEEYIRKSRDTVIALNSVLWRSDDGRYVDCTEPSGRTSSSQHPLAIGLYFDLLEEPQKSVAAATLLHPDLVKAGLYFQHYVLQALANEGRSMDALSIIRRLWGTMVEENSYTIWEESRGRKAFENSGSLCHAFSCAPLYFFQSVILGVKPTKPGFREFTLAPQPAGLGFAKGCIPTPSGPISVQWSTTKKNIAVNIEVPDGTRAITSVSHSLEAGVHDVILPFQSEI